MKFPLRVKQFIVLDMAFLRPMHHFGFEIEKYP